MSGSPIGTFEEQVYADLPALSRAVAERLVRLAHEVLRRQHRFTCALAGGGTPRELYRLLAAEYLDRIPWDKFEFFFGDERCVPPDSAESNYGMAASTLLSVLPLRADAVHRIHGELPPAEAAERYEQVLRQQFPAASGFTSFDLVLLGIGRDGHTASLFPGDKSTLGEGERWVLPVHAPAGVSPPWRVTLTLPMLNRAREVFVLCAGAEKREIVRELLRATGHAAARYPAAEVRGVDRTVWFLDRAASPDE